MRYAILSDIHSNLEALSAVLTQLAAERIDQCLCLGDVIGYGADPTACLSRLQESHAVMVAGNHDQACVGTFDLGWFNDAARAAIAWTRDQLSFLDLDILRRFPLTTMVGPFTLVHGSLKQPGRFEYLIDIARAIDTMKACRTLMCLVGHTHVPCFIEYDRQSRRIARILTASQELSDLTYHDDPDAMRYLLNPGSIGQPRDGDPRASVAVIDTDRHHIAVHRIPYDVTAAQQKIRQAGLPPFLADRLAVGR